MISKWKKNKSNKYLTIHDNALCLIFFKQINEDYKYDIRILKHNKIRQRKMENQIPF